MTKKAEEIQKRRAVIKSLVASASIPNQTALAKSLRGKGIEVTQATLSRDLTELGIARVPFEDGYKYELRPTGTEGALKDHLAEEIISVRANESVAVIRTFPGRAQGVAVVLDSLADEEIIGTIAGDDTIVVIPKSTKRIKLTIQHINKYLGLP